MLPERSVHRTVSPAIANNLMTTLQQRCRSFVTYRLHGLWAVCYYSQFYFLKIFLFSIIFRLASRQLLTLLYALFCTQ